MSSELQACGISVERGGRRILKDASLEIAGGKFTAIIGPNGSGKSTLLKALAGLWPVSAGKVVFRGKAIETHSRREIAQTITFVPQDTRIDFAFTVAEIAGMGRHPHRGRFAPETATDRAAIEAALARCDVAHLKDRDANTLSGGERQRVLIARSLAAQPDIILLDEPTASLDIEHALDVLALCRELASDGHAVVVAMHDLNAVARFADLVALVDNGFIVGAGPLDEVLHPMALERVFGVRAEALTDSAGLTQFLFHSLKQNL